MVDPKEISILTFSTKDLAEKAGMPEKALPDGLKGLIEAGVIKMYSITEGKVTLVVSKSAEIQFSLLFDEKS